jgi:hypothetical protein
MEMGLSECYEGMNVCKKKNKYSTKFQLFSCFGHLHTHDLFIYSQVEVKVDKLWSDDIEVTKVTSGENIKAKVRIFKYQA